MAFKAFLAKITAIKVFFHVVVNTYVPIFRVLDAHGDKNYEQTHTCGTTTVTLAACMWRVN